MPVLLVAVTDPEGPLKRLSVSSEMAPDVDVFFSRAAAPEATAAPGLLRVSSLLARLSWWSSG